MKNLLPVVVALGSGDWQSNADVGAAERQRRFLKAQHEVGVCNEDLLVDPDKRGRRFSPHAAPRCLRQNYEPSQPFPLLLDLPCAT